MGNYSWLVAAMNGAGACAIDWEACRFPEGEALGEGYHVAMLRSESLDLECKDGYAPPATIEALGRALHDHKLFGYLDDGYILALHEISKHCRMADGTRAFPRLYFEEEGWERLHYLEFHPGTDVVMWGYYSFDSSDVPADPEGDEAAQARYKQEYQAALERLIAEPEGWCVRRLLPAGTRAGHRRGSALPVLMTLCGIRPEDPDALERAASLFDVAAASVASADSLFTTPGPK